MSCLCPSVGELTPPSPRSPLPSSPYHCPPSLRPQHHPPSPSPITSPPSPSTITINTILSFLLTAPSPPQSSPPTTNTTIPSPLLSSSHHQHHHPLSSPLLSPSHHHHHRPGDEWTSEKHQPIVSHNRQRLSPFYAGCPGLLMYTIITMNRTSLRPLSDDASGRPTSPPGVCVRRARGPPWKWPLQFPTGSSEGPGGRFS
ncbi:unnamed protein product [Arctogadus glacialis]